MSDNETTDLIEELLRQDAEELRLKRTRLKHFVGTLTELRDATKKASAAAAELTLSGEFTRAQLARAFDLSRAEVTLLAPIKRQPTPPVPTSVPKSPDAIPDGIHDQDDPADEKPQNPAQDAEENSKAS